MVEMTYLDRLPEAIPAGRVLVHNTMRESRRNSVRPVRRLGANGFRAWLQPPTGGLTICVCGWAPELEPHYRVDWG